MPEWTTGLWPALTAVSFVFGVTTFVAALFGLPVVLARIPADYFVAEQPPIATSTRVLRNAVGWPLLVLGLILIPLPGQGLLTVLAGLVLADVPGKRALALFLLRRGPVRRAVDAMRGRRGVEPLLLE
ncbi:MAG: hypothetical protein H6737_03895 [Alphaproteobacteria bacterium]|nr:hypothetical protein [Alphaproteobacteria bacterium]